MPPRGRKRSIDATNEDYESDGGFVENDDDERPKKKTTKTAKAAKSSGSKKTEDDEFWEVSNLIFDSKIY